MRPFRVAAADPAAMIPPSIKRKKRDALCTDVVDRITQERPYQPSTEDDEIDAAMIKRSIGKFGA